MHRGVRSARILWSGMTQGHYVTRGASAPVEPRDAEPPGRLLIRSRSVGLAGEEAVGTTSVNSRWTGSCSQRSRTPAWNSLNALMARSGLGSRSTWTRWTKVTWSSSLKVAYLRPSGRVRCSSAGVNRYGWSLTRMPCSMAWRTSAPVRRHARGQGVDRAGLRGRHPAPAAAAAGRLPGPDRERAPLPHSAREQDLADGFATTFSSDDIDGVIALLTDDAWFTMPPVTLEYQGPGTSRSAEMSLKRQRVARPAYCRRCRSRTRSRGRNHRGCWITASRGGRPALVASRRGPGAVSSAGERFPDTEEVTGSNPVRPTYRDLAFLVPGPTSSALWPYNWPYSERYRWAKTCPGHRTAACGRSSSRAGHSAHSAGSAREGALPRGGSVLRFRDRLPAHRLPAGERSPRIRL